MATKITEFTQGVAITDPKTGLPSLTFLQKINGVLRGAADAINGLVFPATEEDLAAATGGGFIPASLLAPTRVALTDAATVAVDWSASSAAFSLTVAGNRTIGNPSNGIPDQFRTIIVQGSDATNRTIGFGNQFKGELPDVADCNSTRWYALYIHCIAADHFAVSAKMVLG